MENKMSACCVSAADLLKSTLLTLSETTAEPDSKRSRWCSSICKCVAVDIFQPCLWRQNQVYEPNHVYLNLTWASTQRCQETETECKESSIIKKCEADPRLSAHMNENNYTSQRASRRPHVISSDDCSVLISFCFTARHQNNYWLNSCYHVGGSELVN